MNWIQWDSSQSSKSISALSGASLCHFSIEMRLIKTLRNNFESATSNDQLNVATDQSKMVCPVTKKESLLKSPDLMSTREEIIINAAKYVKAAKAQRALAAEKMELLKENPNVKTIVVDYCQNLSIPHLGGEQPGETYYYSPI